MFIYLVLLFTVLPALELALLIKIGTHIGVGTTLMIIILTGIWGATLARLQGFIVFQKIQDNLNRGIMPNQELIDGLMILVGGVVLLTPGFITDTLGFLLLLPISRGIIKKIIQKKLEQHIKDGSAIHISTFKNDNKGYDDIDI